MSEAVIRRHRVAHCIQIARIALGGHHLRPKMLRPSLNILLRRALRPSELGQEPIGNLLQRPAGARALVPPWATDRYSVRRPMPVRIDFHPWPQAAPDQWAVWCGALGLGAGGRTVREAVAELKEHIGEEVGDIFAEPVLDLTARREFGEYIEPLCAWHRPKGVDGG